MWIVILIIWGGSFILTYLNMAMVQKIKMQQQEAEAIIMDGKYVKDNFEKINRVFEKRATLEQPVESVRLGLINIENQIRSICLQHGLTKIVFFNKPAESSENQLAVLMTCEGKSEGIFQLIGTIEKEYPFLPVTAVDLKKNQDGLNFQFQVTMNYRIKIIV
jgi:hypothetical protein